MLELIWVLLNIRFTLAFVIAPICVVLCVWLFPGWPDEYFFGVFVSVMACLLFAGSRRGIDLATPNGHKGDGHEVRAILSAPDPLQTVSIFPV